ncbi:MAG: hypothetical protein IT452_05180 [Planctomycetia bacterium]|nr:hypothetical protein [Planctomycetia bacterium]
MINSRVKCNPVHVRQTLGALMKDGHIYEVRALKCHRPKGAPFTSAGYFNDKEVAAVAIQALDARCRPEGIYFVMNPCVPEVAARADINQFHDFASTLTTDVDVVKRDWLMIDFDPSRPKGISSTDAELQAAKDLAVVVADALSMKFQFPKPLICLSGNGVHLLYGIDFPNDDDSRNLLFALLKAIAKRHETKEVKIDEVVYNASRMCRLYGTANRKGADVEDRPHRLALMLEVPEPVVLVSREQIEAAAAGLAERTQAVDHDKEQAGPEPCPDSEPASEEVLNRAKGYLDNLSPAIEGRQGRKALWIAAQAVVKGFNMPSLQAFALLRDHYNPRCQPAWSDADLLNIVRQVQKNSKKRRGYLLDLEAAGDRVVASGRPIPEIYLDVDQYRCVDEYENAIISSGMGIWQRNGVLVRIRHTFGIETQLTRTRRTPIIEVLPQASLQEIGSLVAAWFRQDKKGELVPAPPPRWASEILASRSSWKFQALESVIETPCMRPDGSIVQTEGYDDASGLYLDLGGVQYPVVPDRPSRDEAIKALDDLKEVIADFPFTRPCHRSAAIAALLTLLGRPAIEGCAPLFAVGAPTAATGKSLLVDAIAVITTGRVAPRTTHAADETEERKRLHSICMEGWPLTLFDNIEGAFGSAVLCLGLTAGWISERILGQSKIVQATVRTVFFSTGNNLEIVGDLVRRVVPIDLDRQEERPEEHSGFKHPNLLEWVRENRPRLVVAGLTILRAFDVAGRPQAPTLSPFGSFEAWSALIRSCLIWLGEEDPTLGREELRERADPVREAQAELMQAWFERYGDQPISMHELAGSASQWRGRHTAGDNEEPSTTAVDQRDQRLRAALGMIEPSFASGRPDVRALGQRLRMLKGRILGGLRLERLEGRTKVGVMWKIVKRASSSRQPGEEG